MNSYRIRPVKSPPIGPLTELQKPRSPTSTRFVYISHQTYHVRLFNNITPPTPTRVIHLFTDCASLPKRVYLYKTHRKKFHHHREHEALMNQTRSSNINVMVNGAVFNLSRRFHLCSANSLRWLSLANTRSVSYTRCLRNLPLILLLIVRFVCMWTLCLVIGKICKNYS